MEEMKSAMERALERAERMGKLSQEEMRQQQESRYVPIGEAIAQRFFEHGYTSILVEQLDKLDAAGKEIATRSALTTLINSIDIENKELTERAFDGIIGLRDSKDSVILGNHVMTLFGQYEWEKKLWYEENSEEIGKEVKEHLARSGISGSAVAEINIANDEEWARKSDELRAEFDSRLGEIRQELVQGLGLA